MLGSSIDSLMGIDYPAGQWRIYVIDDASTDHTPGRDAGEDGAVSGLGVPSAPRQGRPGQGAHAQPRHQDDPGGGLGRGRDDHGRRRAVRANDLAPHGPPFRRPRGRRRHGLREGGQPAARACCRASSPSSTSPPRPRPGGRRTCMGGLPCMAGGAQLHSRENLLAIGGAIDTSTLAEDTYTTIKTQLAGRRALFERQRRRLGRGARQRGRAVEAARALGPRQSADHQRPFAICGSGPTGVRCSATFPSACCGSASP